MTQLASDFNHRFSEKIRKYGQRSVAELVSEVQDAVGTGQPHMVPGTWPPLVRQLYECTDFHFVGNKIFKKRDPVASALDGACGHDIVDADASELEELNKKLADDPIASAFLKDNKDLFRDAPPCWDAMREVTNGLDGDKLSNIYELLDTESLNSPFTALGYQQPRDSYEFVCGRETTLFTDKALQRHEHFIDLRTEISDITDEDVLNRFLWRIRDDYYEDKKLRSQWNRAAFEEDRNRFESSLRRQELDEETIRRSLAYAFDNREGRSPAVFEIVNGKKHLVVPAKVYKASYWQRQRSKALSELILTTAQWSEVYSLCRKRRGYIRQLDNNNRGKSHRFLLKLVSYIGGAKNVKHLEKCRQVVEKYEGTLIPVHRRNIWDAYQAQARRIANV